MKNIFKILILLFISNTVYGNDIVPNIRCTSINDGKESLNVLLDPETLSTSYWFLNTNPIQKYSSKVYKSYSSKVELNNGDVNYILSLGKIYYHVKLTIPKKVYNLSYPKQLQFSTKAIVTDTTNVSKPIIINYDLVCIAIWVINH